MSEIKEACSLLWLIEQSWIPLSLISQECGIFFFFKEHSHIDLEIIPKPRPQTSKNTNQTV